MRQLHEYLHQHSLTKQFLEGVVAFCKEGDSSFSSRSDIFPESDWLLFKVCPLASLPSTLSGVNEIFAGKPTNAPG